VGLQQLSQECSKQPQPVVSACDFMQIELGLSFSAQRQAPSVVLQE
jgi:hypothetical protein